MEVHAVNTDSLKYAMSDDPDIGIALLVDGRNGRDAKVFKRNAVKVGKEPSQWIVGELNGVRVYILDDGTILMTDCDVYWSETVIEKLLNGDYDGDK